MADETASLHQIKVPVRIERASRRAVRQPGTLRERSRIVKDVLVKDLSRSGCLLEFDDPLSTGSFISIGIPGLGMQAARVVRRSQDGHGCEFLLPLNDDDIRLAMTARTVIEVSFPQIRERIKSDEATKETSATTDEKTKSSCWQKIRSMMGLLGKA